MPFLRRRGVMASDTDMRRHTILVDSAPVPPKQLPRKIQSEALLSPDPAGINGEGTTNGAPGGNGEGSKSSVDTVASTSASMFPSRKSEDPYNRPESPPIQDESPKHRRFSMLRFRNASDSQLSARLKQQQQAEKLPPMPQPPAIITTAPTMDMDMQPKKQSRMKIPIRMRRSSDLPRGDQEQLPKFIPPITKKDKRKTMNERTISSTSKQTVTFEEPPIPETSAVTHTDIDDQSAALTPPMNRLSESSRSESSLNEQAVASTQPTGLNPSAFFRLRRKQKQPEPLFPLGHLPQKSKTPALSGTASSVSRTSTSSRPSNATGDISRPSTGHDGSTPLASPSHTGGYPGRPSGSPATALFRPTSRNSGQSSPTRVHLSLRGRSSTMSSLGESFVEDRQHSGTTRTSSSTGRKSFGDLLGLGRMRQNTDGLRHGTLTPATPGSNTSKNNSLQLNREPVILPERREDDTPAKYLARIEEVLSRGVIASALSKGNDSFSAAVLRSYMRTFSFFEEPMDMAIRKLLMEAELPKETQQIDRCLQAFANRYHECNPGIYSTPDQAYFIAFSLLILHTDVFNKNNKYKMQKADYLKNTHGEGIFDDVLECFYDNISYTPFIHVEDDLAMNGDRTGSFRSKKKSMFPNSTTETLRRSKDPIDPYTLILDGRLDTLRPPLKDQIPLEEHYSYLGTARNLNLKELQKTFFKTGVLQIVSARSRPDAFMTEKTANNPQEAHPGIVDIKVTKVGLLWRKDAKKKKTRSPWQEWGAILTGAQLYFFRNTAWVKNLMHQYETHVKLGHDGIPLIFNPPLEQFKPDALMSTHGAVALWDNSYKKHKNSFVYVRHGGLEEVLLAQNEEDRNDWLAKLNYAAAFRTSGVRMRGVIGSNYEGQSRRAIRRLDSTDATQLIQTPSGEVSVNRAGIDHEMARDILIARREIIRQKIEEADEKLQHAQKLLETQLRNARHLLILAPIQDKTRDQVRGGAAKIIAQLKWSRTEIWRLKCHRDILALDLEEEKEVNGNFEEDKTEASSSIEKQLLLENDSRDSSQKTEQQSPRAPAPLTLVQPPEPAKVMDGDSPGAEEFQTPPTTATAPSFHDSQALRDLPAAGSDHLGPRKTSVSSAASSLKLATTSTPPRKASSPAAGQDKDAIDEQSEDDEGERQVLEQAGLLETESVRTSGHKRSSSGKTHDDSSDRPKRTSIPGPDKDGLDRSKMRRSLQRTLRDGAGHLSHHRSRKGKDSASSGGISDETVRENETLTRGTGSFTVHGKKASVVNFGSELQNMSTDERIRQRKQSYQGSSDDHGFGSPGSIDDFHSILGDPPERMDRRGSGASASTATARSFRELHRKYSSSRAHRLATAGGLTVPSDEDSDAAVSFSDGRRSPLPPLDDEDENQGANPSVQARFYTPEPPSSPIQQKTSETGEGSEEETVERLPSPVIQAVGA
ncbi:uncharacterized protein F4822DRAFT_427140 [Hypoxylon trugodes]|uniref:uncharacterized protein n=1 Tax=Hypoxylon trugodes TaxID=326681 RepID=UPI00218EFB4F|nr:uncharacterized protein F4822DRAFT_427140 [Hypoxylon trugodes]KAI1391288.1 hypothetical protein F4822DRAFT_427140 [Hypoxylon trugodes]